MTDPVSSNPEPNPPDPESIFHHARLLAPEARAAYLDRACAGNPRLRAAIEELLSAAEHAGGFLASRAEPGAGVPTGSMALPTAPIVERAGTVIGPYKLLQCIGEGGFGTVFLAEQSAPVKRKVALKIIKLGMDTRQVVARFEAERQALALMDHPHIARVLDGGATASGRPYFVMEYVTGDPIIAFADARRLTLRDRLELFAQVCAAVQHAHTKGIIHRDIKPGNVLVSMVDGRPFAKVIDFGIAKATAQPLTDKTLFTEHRTLIGTPEYMSPEQAEGSQDIDTRTDVYALGVLLYELLTGATPFDGRRLRSAAFDEMKRIIRDEEPPMPSVRLRKQLAGFAEADRVTADAAANAEVSKHADDERSESSRSKPQDPITTATPSRRTPAREQELRGELDWIVMKALEKDRARRYETPNQLAADVQRHLAGEAVVAAPPSRAYRVRKFVRRNKGAVGAVSAVILALAAGGSVAAWQWLRAERINSVLISQRDRAAEGVGKMNSILQGWEGGPLVGRQTDGTTLAEKDPLGWAIDNGLMFAEALKQERDTLMRQRDAAQAGVNKMLSTITSGTTWAPIETATLGDGRPASDDPLQFVISTGQSAAESLRARTDRVQNRLSEVLTEVLPGVTRFPGGGSYRTAEGVLAELAFTLQTDDRGVTRWVLESPPKPATGATASAVFNDPSDAAVDIMSSLAVNSIKQLREQREHAEWSAYTANLALAQAAMDASDFPEARRVLAKAPPTKRGWEGALLQFDAELMRYARREPWHFALASDGVYAFSYGPDDRGEPVLKRWWIADGSVREEIASPAVVPAAIKRVREPNGGTYWQSASRTDPNAVVASNDGRLLAGLDVEGQFVLLDVGAGRTLPPTAEQQLREAPFSMTSDGRFLAFVQRDSAVMVWDVVQSRSIARIELGGDPITALALWTDGSRIVVGSAKGQVHVLRVADAKPIATEAGHRGPVTSLALTPDGHSIISGGEDGIIRAWAADLSSTLVSYSLRGDAVRALCVSPDGGLIAASADWSVHVFDLVSHQRRSSIPRNGGANGNPAAVRFTSDGQGLVIANRFDETGDAAELAVVSVDAEGGPMSWATPGGVAAILASSPNGPSGLTITTPDGTRRIVGSGVEGDKTVRFFEAKDGKPTLPATAESPEGVYREVAVFRMDDAVTNLQMTGDGTRLIIHLADGSARVWDIRDPEERRKDLQAEWAERVPAGAYLDTLWASDTPDDTLRDAVINDASLTPLRRLVAAEMLEERLEDDRLAAEEAFVVITKGQTDKATVIAAADAADLPKRVKDRVRAMAEAWSPMANPSSFVDPE